MAQTTEDMDASMLREKGNEYYKKNEFLLAIEFYQKAIDKAEPNDPLPHSNLSAALFEIGDYAGCIIAAQTALSKGIEKDSSWKERLYLRMVNARLHTCAKDNTAFIPSVFSPPPSPQVRATYTRYNQVYRHHTKEQAWIKIIQQLSPIKPFLSVPEYPVWGNHHAVSLYDSNLAAISTLRPEHVAIAKENTETTQSISNQVSLGFGCTGDARALYATWIKMCRDKALLRGGKHVSVFTNDVRPQTVARNLVIFKLLEDLLTPDDPQHKSLLFHTIYFVYCGQLMPPATETVMRQKFAQVIEMLEDRASFPIWLQIAVEYRQSVVLVLRSWQRQHHLYSPKVVQKGVTNSYFEDVKHGRLSTLENLGNKSISTNLQIELSVYRRTMALFPSLDFANKYEPTLATAIAQFVTLESAQGREVIKIRDYVAQNWKVNPTWYADDCEHYSTHVSNVKPTIENIPGDFFSYLFPIEQPNDAGCFYDFVQSFFSHTVKALRKLTKSMTVTMSIGELLPKLEQARYVANASEWTTTHGFDRIDLANLPDHAGLSLMSHLFVSPLVKKHDAACTSIASGICIFLWTAQNIDITSTALATSEHLLKALGVEHKGYMPEYLNSMELGDGKQIHWYNTWKSLHSKAQSTDQLLSKDSLNTWLYGLFFKLALPSNHPPKRPSHEPPTRVYSPLSLSMFFRLLAHLAEMGYPSHSLSQVLVSILTDSVKTGARPATSQVLTAAEVAAWDTNTKQTLCTAPFFAEMSTLAAIFTRVLPFAIIVNDNIVPSLSSIRKCTVQFSHLPHKENCHYLAIIFTSFGFKPPAGGWGTDTIRGTLLNQEYITKHKNDVIIITTWKYDALNKSGTFWLREDIARKINPEYWMCEVYNTLTWTPLYAERAWSTYLQMQIGESWVDQVM